MNLKSRKCLSALLALLLTLAFIISFSIGIVYSHHDCSGENCEICSHYICLRKITDGITCVLSASICFFGLILSGAVTFFKTNKNTVQSSPVELNVKLSD